MRRRRVGRKWRSSPATRTGTRPSPLEEWWPPPGGNRESCRGAGRYSVLRLLQRMGLRPPFLRKMVAFLEEEQPPGAFNTQFSGSRDCSPPSPGPASCERGPHSSSTPRMGFSMTRRNSCPTSHQRTVPDHWSQPAIKASPPTGTGKGVALVVGRKPGTSARRELLTTSPLHLHNDVTDRRACPPRGQPGFLPSARAARPLRRWALACSQEFIADRPPAHPPLPQCESSGQNTSGMVWSPTCRPRLHQHHLLPETSSPSAPAVGRVTSGARSPIGPSIVAHMEMAVVSSCRGDV